MSFCTLIAKVLIFEETSQLNNYEYIEIPMSPVARKTIIEITVGIFILLGLLVTAFLGTRLGEIQGLESGRYELKARFQTIGGLKVGNRVVIAGVEVGRVTSIQLDRDAFVAEVTFVIDDAIRLDDDTIASIRTAGLIGDQFLNLAPGGSGFVLEEGDTLYDTESAIELESLIKKFAFGDLGKSRE